MAGAAVVSSPGRRAAANTSPAAAKATRALIDTGRPFRAGIVDIDCLDLRVEIEGRGPLFPRPHPSGFRPSEGELCLAPWRSAVDVDDAGLDVVDEPKCGRRVIGEDRCREAVFHRIRGLEGLFVAGDANDAHNRAEDLLLGDLHPGCHVVEDRRLDEMAVAQLPRRHATTA